MLEVGLRNTWLDKVKKYTYELQSLELHRTEEPGKLQSMGSLRIRHN